MVFNPHHDQRGDFDHLDARFAGSHDRDAKHLVYLWHYYAGRIWHGYHRRSYHHATTHRNHGRHDVGHADNSYSFELDGETDAIRHL